MRVAGIGEIFKIIIILASEKNLFLTYKKEVLGISCCPDRRAEGGIHRREKRERKNKSKFRAPSLYKCKESKCSAAQAVLFLTLSNKEIRKEMSLNFLYILIALFTTNCLPT